MKQTLSRRNFIGLCAGAALACSSRLEAAARTRIGITTNTRGGWEKDVLLSFREASEVGYRYVETFYNYMLPWWDKQAELKRIMDGLGLRFVTVSNGGPMKMQFEDAALAQQTMDEHLRLVRWIKWFGCDHLKINTGRRRPEGTTKEDLAQMAKTMNELGKRISDEGLKFGVHPHLWTQLQDRSEIDRLMDTTDPKHVWLVLDTGHITMSKIDPLDLTRTYVSRIIEFHLKDTRPQDRGGNKGPIPQREGYTDKGKRIFLELGSGGVDFPGILAVLNKNNWDGWLTVELDSTDTTPLDSAMKSKHYIESTLRLKL
ncbi:MAG: sugar phosphate isomerase/epimerase family protein [Candidatus Korobacteraceae bacterium]